MTTIRDDFELHLQLTIRQQKQRMNGDYRDTDIHAKWQRWQTRGEAQSKPAMSETVACSGSKHRLWRKLTGFNGH
jgi:hypothetical protein